MKLREYAKNIAAIAEKYPNAQVVSSSDDEGNSFHPIYYNPTAGQFKYGEFISEEEMKEMQMKGKVNAVCVN
jgi:hypothetical protein